MTLQAHANLQSLSGKKIFDHDNPQPHQTTPRHENIMPEISFDLEETIITVGAIRLWVDRYRATVQGKPVRLTAKEFQTLCRLAQQPGVVLPLSVISNDGAAASVDSHRALRMRICSLRRKLGLARRQIKTYRGEGYALEPQ